MKCETNEMDKLSQHTENSKRMREWKWERERKWCMCEKSYADAESMLSAFVYVSICRKSVQYKPNTALPCVYAMPKTHQYSWRAAHQLSCLHTSIFTLFTTISIANKPTYTHIHKTIDGWTEWIHKQSTLAASFAHLPYTYCAAIDQITFMLASMPFKNEKANYLKIRLNNARTACDLFRK